MNTTASDGTRYGGLSDSGLVQLTENLWRVEGALPRGPLKRVMTVARRDDGALVVHSPIAMAANSMAALDALGPVSFLVVPNGFHRLDAPTYAKRYPKARVLTTSGSRGRVSKVVSIAGTYSEMPKDGSVALDEIEGTGGQEGIVRVMSRDGVTLVMNDLVFNMPDAPGVPGFVLKHMTRSSGGPRISRIARLLLVKDRAAVKTALTRIAETPGLRRIIVSHHETINDDPIGVLRRVAETL
jgi:hypothetical protein